MNRPIVAHHSKHDVDETTDTRDTIDWLLKKIPNNSGKVGVLGVSYGGFLAAMAGIDVHPAVKAISPQAPMTDIWLGDDFFHNGAFRETYGFDYVQQLEAQKTDVRVQSAEDTFDFFLRNVDFAGAARSAGMSALPTAARFLAEPAYTPFWQAMAVQRHQTKVEVPTLEVGGYFDQEDMFGPQAEYAALKPHDSKHEVFLVLGPWNHGGWGGPGDKLGALDFGEPTGEEYRKTFEAPFFELYLKNRPGFELKDTASFRTGVNQWQRYASWPPLSGPQAGFTPRKLFLEPEKNSASLSPPAPTTPPPPPTSPIPPTPFPIVSAPSSPTYGQGSKWRTWLAEDQRFVSSRKDLANFTTEPLDHDLTVTGDITADLFAATTGTDTDLIVKLIDVYPDDAPAHPKQCPVRLPAHGCRRDLPRPLSHQLRAPRARQAQRSQRVQVELARRRPHLPQRPPHHGGGPVHLVPALRPQPTDLRPQYHDRADRILQTRNHLHLRLRQIPLAPRVPRAHLRVTTRARWKESKLTKSSDCVALFFILAFILSS